MSRSRLNLLFALLLCAVTGLAYRHVTQLDWVGYDDALYVTQNPNLRDGLTRQSFVWAWTSERASNWHPLTMLSHALDCQLHGLWAGGHHLTNLLLHLANVLLLFAALECLVLAGESTPGKQAATAREGSELPWKAAFVAAMFGVHPLHVESVAWIAERKDVLSALFFFLALIAYTRFVRRPSAWRMSLVALAMTAGLLAKPMLVTLPCVLVLLDYWPLRRFGFEATENRRLFLRCLVEKWPLFGLAIVGSVATYGVQSRTGAVRDLASIPLVDRLANAVVVYATYLWQTLWPVNLTCFYPHPGSALLSRADFWSKLVASAVVMIGLSWLALLSRRRCPAILVGWLWYLGMLVPVIGLVQVGRQAMADRYTYLPLVGVFMAVAWGVPAMLAAVPFRRPMLAAGAVALVVACTLVAQRQTLTWRDGSTLWSHNLAVDANSGLAHSGLAQVFAERKQLALAEMHARRALQIAPDDRYAMLCLAGVLLQDERYDEALVYYDRVLSVDQRLHQAWASRAEVQRRLGRLDAASADLRRAIGLEPCEPSHHRALASVQAERGSFKEAVAEYREVLILDPMDRATQIALGDLLREQGELPAAIEAYRAALKLEPRDQVLRRRVDELLAMAKVQTDSDPP
ncbi:MAG: tetratricopeptide repeat protein [Pirellulales bacterium]|nr:tetratricopeptide repeat protein [Pirellulales bacterium]